MLLMRIQSVDMGNMLLVVDAAEAARESVSMRYQRMAMMSGR
jgi:hypothetical protein